LPPSTSAGDTGLRAVDDMVSPPPGVYITCESRITNYESRKAAAPVIREK